MCQNAADNKKNKQTYNPGALRQVQQVYDSLTQVTPATDWATSSQSLIYLFRLKSRLLHGLLTAHCRYGNSVQVMSHGPGFTLGFPPSDNQTCQLLLHALNHPIRAREKILSLPLKLSSQAELHCLCVASKTSSNLEPWVHLLWSDTGDMLEGQKGSSEAFRPFGWL